MATVMEEVFSKLPLPPFVLTLSKLFLNKNKWICFRNASSHSHLAYSLAPNLDLQLFNRQTEHLPPG